jgi:hypothetical protein
MTDPQRSRTIHRTVTARSDTDLPVTSARAMRVAEDEDMMNPVASELGERSRNWSHDRCPLQWPRPRPARGCPLILDERHPRACWYRAHGQRSRSRWKTDQPRDDRGGGVGGSTAGSSMSGNAGHGIRSRTASVTSPGKWTGKAPGSLAVATATPRPPHGGPSASGLLERCWSRGAGLQTGQDACVPPLAQVHTWLDAPLKTRTRPGKPAPAASIAMRIAMSGTRERTGRSSARMAMTCRRILEPSLRAGNVLV